MLSKDLFLALVTFCHSEKKSNWECERKWGELFIVAGKGV